MARRAPFVPLQGKSCQGWQGTGLWGFDGQQLRWGDACGSPTMELIDRGMVVGEGERERLRGRENERREKVLSGLPHIPT